MPERLKAGIVGCGNIARMHAGNYNAAPSVELVAGADISASARESFQKEHPALHYYESFEQMIRHESLDLVSICVLPGLHARIAIAAAATGLKGILLEKPLALTLPDADAILAACQEHRVTLAIGHQLRYSDRYLTANQLVRAGAIGRVERIWGLCHGAPLQTNATHTIDLMLYLAGDPGVEWVFGTVDRSTIRNLEGIQQEIAGLALFQMKDGPTALIESGSLPPSRGYHHIYLDGSDGQIELSKPDGPPLLLRSESTSGRWETPAMEESQNPVEDLARSIVEGRSPVSGGAQARAVLEVILAIFESARQGRRIPLPLETTENPLAALLTAEGRW